jgi:hypothetical protein
MARKSSWQQFADNFDSTYKTFNTMFSDIEEGKIMSEEPEELQSGIGPGPKSQYQASYGGQIYNEKITPEKLRGLRNQRLIDNMNKWGDTEGAMKLQLDQASLRNQNAAADLAEGQLKDRISNAGLQNKALLASIGLTEAQIEEYKTLLPHKQTEYILNAIAKRSDNRVKIATEGDDISKSGSDASTAESAAKVAALEAENFEETNYLRVKDQKTGYIADINENEAREVGAKVALSENNQKLAVTDMMTSFRDLAKAGEFTDADGNADDQAAQDWMVDQMFNINPTLAVDMRDNYNSHELAVITHSSTMFKTKAMEAYQKGGVEGLSTAIDNLNGVDDTEIEYNDKNDDVTIWAVDPKTKKRLRKIVSGTPGGTFDMNLQQILDPAASMEISKAYHDDLTSQVNVLLKEAEVEYTKEMAAKAKAEGIAAGNTTKEFDKNDFLIRMLVEDPENELAWQGLVGMDLTADEVKEMVLQEKMRKGDKPKVETGTRTDDNKDGVVYKTSNAEVKTPEIPKDSYEVTLANAEKIVAGGPPPEGLAPAATTRYNEALQLIEQLSTAENVQQEIDTVQAELDKSRTGPQPNAKKKRQKDLMAKIAELEIRLKSFSGLKQGG